MAKLRLALAQLDFAVGAVAANAARMAELIAEAGAGGADVVVFPELAMSGYPPEDLLLRPSFLAACDAKLAGAGGKPAAAWRRCVGHPHSEGESVQRGQPAA